MAQAAVASTFGDPIAARAQLMRSQQMSRTVQRPRGQVLAFPGSQMPARAAMVSEDQMYRQSVSSEERQNIEAANNNEWAQHRQKERERMRQFALPAPLPAIIGESPEMLEVPEVSEAIEDYQDSRRQIASRTIGNQARDAIKRQAIDKVKQKLKEEIAKKWLTKQAKKQTSQWLWRLFGRGSVTEGEGALAWGWFGSGAVVTWLQSVKTLVMAEVTQPNPNDPDNGKFLKGVLAFAEPDALDPKDPFVWLIDGPYAILVWFVVWIIFMLINAFLAVVGAVALGATIGAATVATYLPWLTGLIF